MSLSIEAPSKSTEPKVEIIAGDPASEDRRFRSPGVAASFTKVRDGNFLGDGWFFLESVEARELSMGNGRLGYFVQIDN